MVATGAHPSAYAARIAGADDAPEKRRSRRNKPA